MCGLAGIIERHGSPSVDVLRRMAGLLAHRGPDREGVYVSGQVGLAHRRLSILDLSDRAAQPMRSDDGTFVVVYNGEVYNYRELRDGLTDDRPLRTTGDTEVLLRCYEERGAACARDFNGMYAFAMLDQRAGEVVLARDPWGIKPLYYASDGRRFYFASEIKAILAAGFEAAPDQLAVLDNVFTAWTSDERTVFKGVSRLPAGCLLRYNLRTHTYAVERFFSASPDWTRAEELGHSRERWVDAVDRGLTASVASQMVSDVPVGTFCSGGLDSGLVTALASKQRPDLQAFNVSCPDSPDVDEGPYADRLTKDLGVHLHRLVLTRENFRRAVVQSVYSQEMPLMVINAVALQLVSALARREGIRVLLTGEGADEIFGGYMNLYRRHAIARVIRANGRVVGGLIAMAVRAVERLGGRLGLSAPSSNGVPGAHELLTRSSRMVNSRRHAELIYDRLTDPADRALAAELHGQLETYLPPLLHRADRASMGASIELRVPFLDTGLVSLALAMPPALKVGVAGIRPYGKRILKEVAVRHMPAELAYRPKMGFSVPPSYYLGPWPRRWLKQGFVAREFGLSVPELEGWIGTQTDQSACWMLTLEMWGQLFFEGRSVDEVSEEFLGGGATRAVPSARRAGEASIPPGRRASSAGSRTDEGAAGKGRDQNSPMGRTPECFGEIGVAGAGAGVNAGKESSGLVPRNNTALGAEHDAAMADALVAEGVGVGVEFGVAAGLGERFQELLLSSPLCQSLSEAATTLCAMII